MKAWIKKLLGRCISSIVSIVNHAQLRENRNIRTMAYDIAFQEAAEFVYNNSEKALIFQYYRQLWDFVINEIENRGLLLEFGVFQGRSINYFSARSATANDIRTWYGFDSFEGLSENWFGNQLSRGHFSLEGSLPKVRNNVELIKGWIDETLPEFLACHKEPIAFIHIDTDTYTPASTILKLCKPRLQRNSIILFDEMLCHPNWRNGEFRALQENFSTDEYEYIGFCQFKVAIRIL